MKNIEVPTYAHRFVNNYLAIHNVAQRGKFDGNYQNQFTGILGEAIVHEYIFGELPQLKEGNDHGIDMIYKGFTIDVKTMKRKGFIKPYFVHNFLTLQLKTKTDILIFNNYCEPKNIIQICGWIYKDELLQKGQLIKKGSKRLRADGTELIIQEDTIEVEQRNLKPFILKSSMPTVDITD